MSNESQKENQSRGVEREQSREESAEREEYTGRPHLAELEENPLQFDQAKHVISLIQKTKEFLMNRAERLRETTELEKEIKIKSRLMDADDAEPSEENIIRLRAAIAGIEKELEMVLDVLGRDNPAKYAGKAQLQKFYAEPFSWKSNIVMLFGGKERIMKKRDQKNESVSVLLMAKARELIREAESAIVAEGEKYRYRINIGDFKKSIIEADSAETINEKRKIIDALFAKSAKQEQLGMIAEEFNNNSRLVSNKNLERDRIHYQSDSFSHYLSDNLGEESARRSSDLIRQRIETLQQQLSEDGKYAVTREAEDLVADCNELGQKFQNFREFSLSNRSEIESKEISHGRVLTHSALKSTIYETLEDGELMSVEAQARKKGKSKRTHGVNLVKENFMEDRNLLESHSLSFEVDAVYRNFVNLAEAPIVMVLDENHFLSKGYQFGERDGEHLFSPDYDNTDRSVPLAIDLRENPVVFMVREDEYAAFCKFLLEKSAWNEMLKGLDEEERRTWMDKRVFRCSLSYKEVPIQVSEALREISGPPQKGYVGLTSALGHLKGGAVNLKKFILAK